MVALGLLTLLAPVQTGTQVIMLGTGSPVADPKRNGPSLAIVSNGTAYMVDAGVNCVRQADAAFHDGIAALQPVKITTLFLTHLHTDHTLGYPDLILTPWDMGRTASLNVYGPQGTKTMTANLLEAWTIDISVRTSGLEGTSSKGYKPIVREFKAGEIFRDKNITVTAFKVLHGSFPNSFGFKFRAKDRTIVVSGDTRPCPELIKQAKGADILVHEVYSLGHYQRSSPTFQKYLQSFHTSSTQLANIAKQVKPKLLVLTHKLGYFGQPPTEFVDEIRSGGYEGEVVSANDLDRF
ncbi:MAG: MBL fold metallo-hydrolase [Fimbriimonadaceae bacterium]|nr:MBL fold metallo-hydrolase [Fimbriimonadaceae bacterium]